MTEDILVSFIAAFCFGLTAFYVASNRRRKPTWKPGVALLLVCAELTFARAMQGISPDFSAKVFWYKMCVLGFTVSPTAFLILALYYSKLEHALTPKIKILLSIVPVITAVLIITNEQHGLIWNPARIKAIIDTMSFLTIIDGRAGYWFLVAYAYFMMGLGCYFLISAMDRSQGFYDWEVRAVAVAAILACLGPAFDIFAVSPFKPFTATALGLAAGSISVVFLLSRFRRRDLIAATRRAIIDSMNDLIIVIDIDDRIVDINPAAEKWVRGAAPVIGKSLQVLLPELRLYLAQSDDTSGEVTLSQNGSTCIFDLRLSTIKDWRNLIIGRMFNLHDITQRKKFENALAAEREIEKEFSQQLTTLAAVTNDLSKIQNLDDLCREAVEAGRDRLGFDRLALWFITEDHTTMLGTFGTSEDGQTTDERHAAHQISPSAHLFDVVEGKTSIQHYREAPLYRNSQQVGIGERVTAGLWDGEKVIGFLSIDNYINHSPFSEHDLELLQLYASTLGHLCTLKRVQDKLTLLAEELEERVAQRTAELETANRELEAFAYSVSHDLRAPLRAIDGYTHILVEDYGNLFDDEGKRLCGIVRDKTHHMDKLIEDLLAFSRVSHAEMRKSQIDMAAMVEVTYQDIVAPQEQERIDLQVEGMPMAMGDPSLLRQVWINLLSNAIKFSRQRERAVIRVTCTESEDELVYAVSDNGAGFDMQYVNKLYGVFQRLHNEQEFPGTGIGLAITQRVIHRHGGRVWAEGAISQGATFFFSLPK